MTSSLASWAVLTVLTSALAPGQSLARDPSPRPLPPGAGLMVAAPSGEIAQAVIEGALSYPGERLPHDLTVCAVNLATTAETCSSKQIRLKRQGRPKGYRLTLPPGRYQVYSTTSEVPDERANYTDLVRCGYAEACKSHRPLDVELEPGTARTDVDPGDWYDERRNAGTQVAPAGQASSNNGQKISGAQRQATGAVEPFHLVGRANESCERATPRLAVTRSTLSVSLGDTSQARAGDSVTLTWSVMGVKPSAPTYLMVATSAPVRLDHERPPLRSRLRATHQRR